ncbi:MAG: shikimate dehydrogenase [Chloroflexota bacterium]|jgi:shikimate dehydrogenase
MSKRVVLLGQPVTHSLSEALQEAAFAAAGIDAHYEPLDTPTVDLPDAVKALRGEEYLGANIGVPHKDRVVQLLDRLTEEAQATGAVDTITREGDQLVGHNTDVLAFKPALEELVGNQKMPRNAVVVGAGGGGRAVIYSLIQAGFQNIALFNRHLHRGEKLVKHFARSASHMDLKARPWHESVIEAELAKTDILINASAMGRDPEETPIPGELLPPDILVMDLHYVPEETRLLREAREAGATKVMNGDVMLIEQTIAAFELWTGEKAPVDVIRKQLKASRNKPDVPVPPAEEQSGDGQTAEASTQA